MPPKKQLPYIDPTLRQEITEFAGVHTYRPPMTDSQNREVNRAVDSYRLAQTSLQLENELQALPDMAGMGDTPEEYEKRVVEMNNKQTKYFNLLKAYAGKHTQHEAWGYFWKDKFMYPQRPPSPSGGGGGKRQAPALLRTYGRRSTSV